MNPTRQSCPSCPSCGADVRADAQRCPACDFTGGDTMVMFPDPAPPLLPVLDAAGLWDDAGTRKIEAALEKQHRRFPQFRFRICTVMLPDETKLPVFGFWLLNASPLQASETAEERAWTVLLLIDSRSGGVAAIPGYAAGCCFGDEDWKTALAAMAPAWKSGKPVRAVIRFLETSASLLEHAWKRRGSRRSVRVRRSAS